MDEGTSLGQRLRRLSLASPPLLHNCSEKQKNGQHLSSFADFEKRLRILGLDHLTVLYPMGYWDVTFSDRCVFGGPQEFGLEEGIHGILFASIPFDPTPIASDARQMQKWRSAKCDVQAFWAHVHHQRDAFVTSDENFHKATKKPKLIALAKSSAVILRPAEAASLI